MLFTWKNAVCAIDCVSQLSYKATAVVLEEIFEHNKANAMNNVPCLMMVLALLLSKNTVP